MELVTDLESRPRPPAGAVVTIGVFDGVHLGHREVIGVVRRRAEALGVPAVVVTFDPHPAMVVRPESAPPLLTDIDQRLELLEAAGVDMTVVIAFDQERAREEPEDFVSEVLVQGLGATVVVVGDDFHFGRARRGNAEMLESIGANHGFEVVRMDPVTGPTGGHGDTTAVSSTSIRRLVEAGEVDGAAVLLGREYEVRGTVVKGDQRGRELGFPTANLETRPEILLPGLGIYAGWFERQDGSVYRAAISVGRRTTFHGDAGAIVLEAYLLDFDEDLYGERARVRFAHRIRGEERFGSADALIAQMERDVADVDATLPRQP